MNLNNSKAMNFKKLKVKIATHYHLEAIDGIYDASLQVKAKLAGDISKEAQAIEADSTLESDERQYMLSSLGDDFFIAEITTELAGEMMVVALYKTVEISIKQMAKASELFTVDQLRSFYKISDLKKQFKKKICDIKTLKNYKAYDELRCINNAIKHSGVVDKDLAAYPGFKKGEKLADLHKHYNRLRDNVDGFVIALQDEILKKIP